MMTSPSTDVCDEPLRADVCILLDACVPAYVYRGLRRRGFRVRRVGNDVTQYLKDRFIIELARRDDCVIVTLDRDFEGVDNAVIIPHEVFRKNNSWGVVTKVVKAVFTALSQKCGDE